MLTGALRERIHKASLSRGTDGGIFDNTQIIAQGHEITSRSGAPLRGFANYADYRLSNQTAGSVAAVNQRLGELALPAVANAEREAADIQAMIDAEGGEFEVAAWGLGLLRRKSARGPSTVSMKRI